MTLEWITSDSLNPVSHGFFTRRGGASSGVFEGLNCGLGSSDQREIVGLNRQRVANAMGVETDHLITVHQVHSADVVTVDKPGSSLQKADALVTATPGLTLAVLTADCQPVLFSDPQANVVGAAHAGWRGAMAGVLEATVGAMEGIGAARHNIRACVGPTISQAAYEVGPEFLDDFLQEDPGNSRFFAQGNKDRYQFDLPGYGLKKLRDLGIAEATWTGHCTYRDEDRFFSYRRSVHRKEADYGRLISCIKL